MSGIFGLVDPDGVDGPKLEQAASVITFRGRPSVWTEGAYGLGCYDGGGWASVHAGPDAVLAFDGRIDGTVDGTPAARLGATTGGPAWLAGLLGGLGPEGLAGVAGDFAIARFDRRRQSLLLTRDAFGARPLFWSRRSGRVAFASDPEVLWALGFGSRELEPGLVGAYLAGRDFGGERTVFLGIRRVPGGRWVEVSRSGAEPSGRWFRPDDVAEEPMTIGEAVDGVRELVQEAVRARTRGRAAALLLSGGRDSASVAMAASAAGVQLSCLGYEFDADLGCSELGEARLVAERAGFHLTPVLVPSSAGEADLLRAAGMSGTPLGFPAFTQPLATHQAVSASGAQVVLDGDGGEPLFIAGPVAVVDLLRRGRAPMAMRAGRAYAGRWKFSATVVAKAAGRAVLPRSVVRARDRRRRIPPWVVVPTGTELPWAPPARSVAGELRAALLAYGISPIPELWDRMLAPAGARLASPLLDQRVVQFALRLPLTLRLPVPGPKRVLAGAFLGDLDATRRKTSFLPYYDRLAAEASRSLPGWLGPDARAARAGLVDGACLDQPRLGEQVSSRWRVGLLHCLVVEGWLRHRGEG